MFDGRQNRPFTAVGSMPSSTGPKDDRPRADVVLGDRYGTSCVAVVSEVIEIARGLARKYPMVTINNESRELNQHRIQTFKLSDLFNAFVSSCYVGIRKPDARIYQLALDLTQRNPHECCFIDDRPANVAAAKGIGMNAVQMRNPAQLQRDLQKLGVDL